MDFTDLGSSLLRSSWSPTRRSRVGLQLDRNGLELELHEVIHHRLRSSPSRPSWSPTRRSRVGLQLGRDGLDLKLHKEEDKYTEAKSIKAKSKSNEAQPSWTWTWLRWTWLRCTCPPPSATSVQCWREGRQVHRGAAEVYLSFLRVNFAYKSVKSMSSYWWTWC